jgi:hypothetical protein
MPAAAFFFVPYWVARREESSVNKKRNMAVSMAAAALSGALVYGIYQLQLRQIDYQETVQVAVPLRFIAAGEQLTADNVGLRPISKASYMPEMIVDARGAIGLETAVPLGKDEPILEWKIDRYRLLPGRDESTFQIPKTYVLSVSNGIRAGDRVLLYVSDAQDGSGDGGDGGGGGMSGKLFPEPVTVASVKSSSNTEIDGAEHSNLISMANGDRERMYASRRDANGVIDAVNLNLTESQWLRIDELCRDGRAKLVIAYSSIPLLPGDSASPGVKGP